MNVKKYYPFIIPTIALLLVVVLAFRWYHLRTSRQEAEQDLDIQIENLTEDEMQIVRGTEDVSTLPLEPEKPEEFVAGQVRYKVQDDRLLVTINAELPQIDQTYQVWFKAKDVEVPQKAFVLAYGKGGYMGSASLSAENLPLELIVSQETNAADMQIEQELLRGTIEAEAVETE